jgi:hypothetical protein
MRKPDFGATNAQSKGVCEQLTGSRLDGLENLFPQVIADAIRRAPQRPSPMGGPGDFDLLYSLAEHLQATRIVESGVAYGWSSLALLLSLKKRPGSKLISTDKLVPCGNYDEFVGCVVPSDLTAQWSVVRLPDRQALPDAISRLRPLDPCHYDSDKSYEGRMWPTRSYGMRFAWEESSYRTISQDNVAFHEFSQRVSVNPSVIRTSDPDVGEKFIGLLVKRRP